MSRRAAARAAWSLWTVLVALVVGGMVLVTLNRSVAAIVENAGFAVVFLAMGTMGALVASRRPENPIGWIFVGVSVGAGVGFVADQYAVYALRTNPGMPGGVWAAWVNGWIWLAALSPLVTFLFLLFPDGRLLSSRWRPVAWISGGFLAVAVPLAAVSPELETAFPVDNPLGIEGMRGVVNVAYALGFPVFGAMILASAASLIVRFRRAGDQERQQIKWFGFAAVLLGVWFVITLTLEFLDLPALDDSVFGTLATMAAIAGIPIAAGFAILKYRLYDIDRVINQTVVYGLLTAALFGVYVGAVAGIGALARALTGQESNSLVVVASTLAVAALFRPLRARLQTFIDRRFYRHRYDAAATLDGFSARLRDQVDLESLRSEIVTVIGSTMQPAHASLWLRHHEADISG